MTKILQFIARQLINRFAWSKNKQTNHPPTFQALTGTDCRQVLLHPLVLYVKDDDVPKDGPFCTSKSRDHVYMIYRLLIDNHFWSSQSPPRFKTRTQSFVLLGHVTILDGGKVRQRPRRGTFAKHHHHQSAGGVVVVGRIGRIPRHVCNHVAY